MADSSKEVKKPEYSKPGEKYYDAWHTQRRRKKRKEAQE